MPPTVAVTGATGFIGAHVARRLRADGWRLRVLTRHKALDPALAGPEVEAVTGALEDRSSLERLLRDVDAVVHVAGLIRARSRAAFFRANAEAVGHMAAITAAAPRPPRFILMSSLAAREPDISDYAASKRAGEQALIAAGDRLPWTILRPPAVYGPGDRATLSFFRCVAHGFGPVLGSDTARISLIHAKDLADAVGIAAGEDPAIGLVAEVGDDRGGYRWQEMVAAAAGAFGRPARILRIPRAIPAALGAVNLLLRRLPGYTPLLTPGKVRELYHHDWVCDSGPLMARTSWRPRITLDQGFAGTIAWYREHGWL